MIELLIGVIIPWVITFFLAALILIFAAKLKELVNTFWQLPWFIRLIFLLIFVSGVLVRFYLTPNQHRIYYDEDRYLSYSLTFAKFGEAKTIIFASQTKVLQGDPDKAARLTVPIFNAWIFKIFGFAEKNVFAAAKVTSSLQIILIFMLAYLMFDSHIVALFSALGMALLPTPVYWAPSTTLDPYFVFFTLLSFISIYLYVKKPTIVNGFFLLTTIFLVFYVRIEALFSVPFYCLAIFTSHKFHKNKFLTGKNIVFYSLVILVVLIRLATAVSVVGKQWCCAEGLPIEAFYPSYFLRNVLPNVTNLFTRTEFPFFITILGLIALVKMRNKNILILGLWFIGYFILYSTYYAGMFFSNEFSGSYGRYFLILTPPLLLLAGNTLRDFIFYIKNRFKKKAVIILILSCLITIYTFLPTIRYYKQLVYTSPYYQLVEAGPVFTHEVIEKVLIPGTPNDSVILTSIASLPLMYGHPTGLFGSFFQEKQVQDYVFSYLKKGKRVFAIYPYFCDSQPNDCGNVANLIKLVVYKKGPYDIPIIEIKLKNR